MLRSQSLVEDISERRKINLSTLKHFNRLSRVVLMCLSLIFGRLIRLQAYRKKVKVR
uniref:Uncharacterized protein n=1 Tax=Hyaloperonospora arabidopsidis (strain Emoy2) TaxID=559515 RepID=M4BKN1_HYAAE